VDSETAPVNSALSGPNLEPKQAKCQVYWILSERETVVEFPCAAESCPCGVEAANRVPVTGAAGTASLRSCPSTSHGVSLRGRTVHGGEQRVVHEHGEVNPAALRMMPTTHSRLLQLDVNLTSQVQNSNGRVHCTACQVALELWR
jgi:hypothetical protein